MKSAVFTCLLLISVTMTALSQQQPSGRRGLDQIDLLTPPPGIAVIGNTVSEISRIKNSL